MISEDLRHPFSVLQNVCGILKNASGSHVHQEFCVSYANAYPSAPFGYLKLPSSRAAIPDLMFPLHSPLRPGSPATGARGYPSILGSWTKGISFSPGMGGVGMSTEDSGTNPPPPSSKMSAIFP